MQIEHPSMNHMNNKEEKKGLPEVPVHVVSSPEDEAAIFSAQMAAAENSFAEVPLVTDGVLPVLEEKVMLQELGKKEILEKLVFFKQDHCKELTIGGLKFKLRLLNSNDHSYINKIITENNIKEVYKRSLLTVSAAIISVNDMKLEEFFSGPSDVENPILRKYFELCQWHVPVTTALIEGYTSFQSSVEGQYTKDFLD